MPLGIADLKSRRPRPTDRGRGSRARAGKQPPSAGCSGHRHGRHHADSKHRAGKHPTTSSPKRQQHRARGARNTVPALKILKQKAAQRHSPQHRSGESQQHTRREERSAPHLITAAATGSLPAGKTHARVAHAPARRTRTQRLRQGRTPAPRHDRSTCGCSSSSQNATSAWPTSCVPPSLPSSDRD
jgi:hypothetical protein